MTPQGVETMKNLGYSHPQNFIHENPDWLLNHEIYILQKLPGIRYKNNSIKNVKCKLTIAINKHLQVLKSN